MRTSQFSLRALFVCVTIIAIAVWQLVGVDWSSRYVPVVLVAWAFIWITHMVTIGQPQETGEGKSETVLWRLFVLLVGTVSGALVGCALGFVIWLFAGGSHLMTVEEWLRLGGLLGATFGLACPRWAIGLATFVFGS